MLFEDESDWDVTCRPAPGTFYQYHFGMGGKVKLLAIGAHPDDIEIGAAALICKAVERGDEVYFLVLSDDNVEPAVRRHEAMLSAKELGVRGDHILFAGLPDGHIRADGTTVSIIRDLVEAHIAHPDIVVTHSSADSHNDHVESHKLAHATFRNCVYLQFSIHISSEVDRFAPRVFIAVTKEREKKKSRALESHRSQRARIAKNDLSKYEEKLGKIAGLERAEGFEVSIQWGASELVNRTLALSDSPFHRFWLPIVGESVVTLLYEEPEVPANFAQSSAHVHQCIARDRLRRVFAEQWTPTYPLREQYSNTDEAMLTAKSGSVILAGGAHNNLVVQNVYNLLGTVDWSIEGDSGVHYLHDKRDGSRFRPSFLSNNVVERDYGVISRIPNPFAPRYSIVFAGGTTCVATRFAVEFVANPGSYPELAEVFFDYATVQVAFSVAAARGDLEILDVSRSL